MEAEEIKSLELLGSAHLLSFCWLITSLLVFFLLFIQVSLPIQNKTQCNFLFSLSFQGCFADLRLRGNDKIPIQAVLICWKDRNALKDKP